MTATPNPATPKSPRRPLSAIVDEIHGRAYDMCALAAVVEKLTDCDAPGAWRDVMRHIRDSLQNISRDLMADLDEYTAVEEGRC